jgi:hypothetical protein
MTLNNSKTIVNLKIRARAAIILYLTYLILAYAAGIIKFPVLGLSSTAWTIILTVCFFVIILFPVVLKYQYVFYSDDGNDIVLRYFSTGVVAGNKNSVEINKKTFTGLKIEKEFFGFVQRLVLFQRLKEGVAKYPPIYLSALNRSQKQKLISSLTSYAPIMKD